MNLLSGVLMNALDIFRESAFWMLFGFVAAGLAKALISDAFISRHLGGEGLSSVLKASFVGVPLPL